MEIFPLNSSQLNSQKFYLSPLQTFYFQGTLHPDTRTYRTAAVQAISLGEDKEKAYALMRRARLIEGKKFECDTSERTKEIMVSAVLLFIFFSIELRT